MIEVYTPNSRIKTGFGQSLVLMLNNVISSRELIKQLFLRDFLAFYKKSFLGLGWVIISPIFGIISWVFMNAAGILHPGDVGIPYPAYVLIGTTIWGMFLGVYQSTTATLTVGQGFIMQVKYPHEVLVVKQILDQLVNFFISLIIIFIVLLVFRITPAWQVIFLPLLVMPLVLLASAIGLTISIVSVVAGELKRLVDIFLFNLVLFTPIVYSPQTTNQFLGMVIKFNPLTYLVGTIREIIVSGQISNLPAFLLFSVISFLLFIFALRLFYLAELAVVEKMI